MGNQCRISQTQHFMISMHIVCKNQIKQLTSTKNKFNQNIEIDCQISSNCILVNTESNMHLVNNRNKFNNEEDARIISMIDFEFEDNFIKIGQKYFEFNDALSMKTENQIWRIVTEKIQIQKNTVFKIDQLRFLFLGIYTPSSYNFQQHNSHNSICKICYEQQTQSQSDPLIAPCKCNGTLEYIHLKCLKDQLKQTEGFFENNTGFRIKKNKTHCSICKHPYQILQQNKIITLPQIFYGNQSENQNYIIMQFEEKFERFIMVQKFYNNIIQIGRSSSNNIKIESCKISRKHMKLTYDKQSKKLSIQDCGSKFGTLIQINKPIFLGFNDEKIKIKVGKNEMSLSKIIKIVQKNRIEHYRSNNIPIIKLLEQNKALLKKYDENTKIIDNSYEQITKSYESTFEDV